LYAKYPPFSLTQAQSRMRHCLMP